MRFRYLIVVVWVGITIGAIQLLPPLSSVTRDTTIGFLPATVPSMQAAAMAAPFQDPMQRRGHHVPRSDEVWLFDAVATSGISALEDQLELFGQRLTVMSHASPRLTRGLLTMTAHQSKGREFDAVVLYGATSRHFPGDDEARRLFYVALSRARMRWSFVAPSGQESPLLAALRA